MLTLSLCLLSALALAREKPPVIRYQVPADDLDERPQATEIYLSPQGSDFGLRVVFDKAPWGEACQMRCANVTVLVDTDNSRATGMQLGKAAAETGADLAITLQGTREYAGEGGRSVFRAVARFLPDDAKSIGDGSVLTELDHERDSERLQVDERTVYVLVDGTSASLPTSKKARFIYHPAGAKALEAPTRGMLAAGPSGGVKILKGGRR